MRNNLLAALLTATLLPACSLLHSEREQVSPVLPAAWAQLDGAQSANAVGEHWWTLFGDPVLDTLVAEALEHNHDVAVAAARVQEAEATLGVTDADRYPVVTAGANGSRRGISEKTSTFFGSIPRYQNNVRATLDASYELDLWGKYRRASDAARAQLLSAEAGQDTVALTLSAQVSQQYFNLLAADAQIAVLNQVLQTRMDSLALLQSRSQAGVSSDYEVRQAEAEVASVKSQLASAQKTQDTLESALAILLGRSPRDVMQGKLDRGVAAPMQVLWVPDGLPSELLLRRPDLRQAEQQLLAEDARIDVARADYFPSISLTAFLGQESATMGSLFSGPAGIFQFALGITQPIFNAGRLKYSIKVAEARRQQALESYRKAIAEAFGDVRNALTAQTSARKVFQAESERVKALQETLRLANLRYEGGVSSRLEVLDADRQLLQAKLASIDAENAQRAAVVSLFKALGGGWKPQVASAH